MVNEIKKTVDFIFCLGNNMDIHNSANTRQERYKASLILISMLHEDASVIEAKSLALQALSEDDYEDSKAVSITKGR